MTQHNVLATITDTLEARREASSQTSYAASLFRLGEEAILKKMAEENTEVLIASKDKDKLQLVREVADLWFHSMVLLTYHGLRADDVLMELKRREGISGLDEKAARQP